MTKAACTIVIKCKPGPRTIGVKNEFDATFGFAAFGMYEKARVDVLKITVWAKSKHESALVVVMTGPKDQSDIAKRGATFRVNVH